MKAYAYSAAFLVTGLLTCLILVIVFGTRDLKRSNHYILLCQHCVCVTGFNAAGATLHGLHVLQAPVTRLVCWLIVDLQVVFARALVITLTLMSMNISLSIRFPLHYSELVRRVTVHIQLIAWTLALLNPVLFTLMAYFQSSWEYMTEPATLCSGPLEGFVPRITALTLLALLILLIVVSYVVIYVEGHRAGHFSHSNKKGRRTILIHALQLSLHLFPSIIIIVRVPVNLTAHVVNFLVFCVAQSLSPIVYGLRCHDIWSRLPMFLPHFLLTLLTRTTPAAPIGNTETTPGTAVNTAAKSITRTHTLTREPPMQGSVNECIA